MISSHKTTLLIGIGGIGGDAFSRGLRTLGGLATRKLDVKFRYYQWTKGREAGEDARSHDGPVVLIWHSAGKKGSDDFCGAFGRKVDLAFAVDSWLPGEEPHELIRKVYSIKAGRGGRFHVHGHNVVSQTLYPDETHTSIDDEPKLHDFVIAKMRELTQQSDTQIPDNAIPQNPLVQSQWVNNRFNRRMFFDHIRNNPFDGKFTQGQVDGLNRLLDTWETHCVNWDMRELAYNLATGFHETGRVMQPIMEAGDREYFERYEKRNDLGNTQAGDGYRFRGAGDVQNTGRRNAQRATDELNAQFDLGIDLVANPDDRLDPQVSALSLFLGNHQGWWTSKRLTNFAGYGNWDMKGARSVINGSDRWEEIGKYAGAFLNALKVSARTVEALPPKNPPTPPATPPADPAPLPTPPITGELTLENVRKVQSADLRKVLINSADAIKLITLVLDERANDETGVPVLKPAAPITEIEAAKPTEDILMQINDKKTYIALAIVAAVAIMEGYFGQDIPGVNLENNWLEIVLGSGVLGGFAHKVQKLLDALRGT